MVADLDWNALAAPLPAANQAFGQLQCVHRPVVPELIGTVGLPLTDAPKRPIPQ